MAYKVVYFGTVGKDLDRLDYKLRAKIIAKIENYLVINPQQLGEALTGSLKGYRRYRFGDYRIIYHVDQEKIIITVVRIGHRRDVYLRPLLN